MDERLGGSKVRARILWGLWFVFVAAWSIALLTPHPTKVAEAVFANATHRFHAAKTLHVTAYFVLTVLTTQLPVRQSLSRLLLLFPSLHALATEGLQNFVPTRTGSWQDVGFDHIGIGLGLAVVGIWSWRSASSRRRDPIAGMEGTETREEVDFTRARSASKSGPC